MEIPSYVNDLYDQDVTMLRIVNNFIPTAYAVDIDASTNRFSARRVHVEYNHKMHHGNVYKTTCRLLDTLGQGSAKAQNLKSPITSAESMRQREDYVVYILIASRRDLGLDNLVAEICPQLDATDDVDRRHRKSLIASGGVRQPRLAVGMIKVGRKHLYLNSGIKTGDGESVVQCEPLCLLDFYISPDFQRLGLGRRLFEAALNEQGYGVEDYHKIAIDRPSDSMMNFMARHYGLDMIIPQTNNFVIYSRFFDSVPTSTSQPRNQLRRLGSSNSSIIRGTSFAGPSSDGENRSTVDRQRSIVRSDDRVDGRGGNFHEYGQVSSSNFSAERSHRTSSDVRESHSSGMRMVETTTTTSNGGVKPDDREQHGDNVGGGEHNPTLNNNRRRLHMGRIVAY